MGYFLLSKTEVVNLINSIADISRDLIRLNGLGKYYLTEKLQWFFQPNITKLIQEYNLTEYSFQIFDILKSTNSYLLENIEKIQHKTIVTAEHQSHGRGRADKKWISRVGRDIVVSICYWFDKNFEYHLLPFISVIAVNRTMNIFNIKSYIKWPNDILLLNRDKIGGVLVETGVKADKRYAVVGIGLDNIDNINRDVLLVSLIKNLDIVLDEYKNNGFESLKQEWLANCIHYQHEVNILKNNQIIDSGVHVGIGEIGELILTNNNKLSKYTNTNISLKW